jgi:long-subunit fatty acid transport protein
VPDARVTVPAVHLPLDDAFRSSRSSRTGPEYELGSAWSLFAGVTNTDARTPGMPRHWTGAGLGYRPNENWNVDFGFVHPYTSDTRFIDPLTAGNPLVNGPSGRSQLFGLSGRYRFDFDGH